MSRREGAVCRNTAAAAHGGRIWAESDRGRGTTVRLELPLIGVG